MAVNARDTYGHESWAVDFQKFARKDCFFRVMPKLRIRAKGEPVRAGDAVVFQSIKTEGFLSFLKQFTESSPLKRTNSTRLTKSLGLSTESDFDATGNDPVRSRHSSLENVSKGWHEVCISSQPHGWTICHFESPLKTLIQKPLPAPSNTKSVASAPSSDASGDKNILKAGSYIRLYHKEKQGYVNAFKDLTGQDLLYHEQVQLAEYSFDALNPQETTSATTFWQVEHKFPFQGTQIPWNQPVRLRHAALNAYLHVEQVSNPFMGSRDNLKPSNFAEVNKPSVFGDYFVTLRSNPGNTSNCLFMFVPVTASTSNVTIGTHVRIQHVGSGCWLSGISSQLNRTRHMEASTYKAARKLGSSELGANLNFNESFKGPGPLMLNVADKEVEQTDLYVLTASTQQHADDYFAISDVEADLAENFRYIHSMVPAVERFLSTSRKGERDQADKKKSERSRTGDYVDSEKFPISKAELTSFKGVIVSCSCFCK